MFFKKYRVYELTGTIEDARRHISVVAKNWSQFTIELGKYPDALWIYPNPLPSSPNPGPKSYYPFFHGKLLATSNGVALSGAVSIGGYRFEVLRILLIGIILNFAYLTLDAILSKTFFWAILFSLLGVVIFWIFMQFCVLSASTYEEKTKALEAFLNELIYDIQQTNEFA